MNNERLSAMGALILAADTLEGSLKARGYVPGTNVDDWEPQVRSESEALQRVRGTIARLQREYGARA